MAKGHILCEILTMLAVAQLMFEAASAINCIEVDLSLRQCVPYVTGQAEEPVKACCDGIAHIKSLAATAADRQAACRCIKEAASHIQGLKESCVSALPAKCNCPLPYPISTSVDCSVIH